MLRKDNFKLGRLHGRVAAQKKQAETHIQRILFLNQRLSIVRSRKDSCEIKLFGYEIPLEHGCSRVRCIDLMGYDQDHNLYLIELKRGRTSEQMPKIIRQINDYADMVRDILPNIEQDFKRTFFLPIRFRSIRKVVLAPREFYTTERRRALIDPSVEYAYFRNVNIAEYKLTGNSIGLHLVK